MTQSEANQKLAAQQTHSELHPGHGVIARPTHDDIAKRAYDIYLNSGCKHGRCEQNWLQSEHDLRTIGRRS